MQWSDKAHLAANSSVLTVSWEAMRVLCSYVMPCRVAWKQNEDFWKMSVLEIEERWANARQKFCAAIAHERILAIAASFATLRLHRQFVRIPFSRSVVACVANPQTKVDGT